jgi:hypothetical protein
LVKYSDLSGNLNVASDFYYKNFKFNDIYRSSLCSDIYDYEQREKLYLKEIPLSKRLKLLSEIFPNEKITATTIKDYFKWRSYYYGT